jgi:leucine-zipper of insertion element IS481
MRLHGKAALSWKGRRRLARRVVVEGWTLTAAAAAAGVSVRCARKWAGRYRAEGERGLLDRSSAPRRVANRTPADRVAAIIALRRRRMTAAEIAETQACLCRSAQRQDGLKHGRLPPTRSRVLPAARDPHRADPHRQRRLLPRRPPRTRVPPTRDPSQSHTPLPATDKRQSLCLRIGVPSAWAVRLPASRRSDSGKRHVEDAL